MAVDFFTVEAWTPRGLRRFVVLFFIELATRGVELAGIAATSKRLWMDQIGRNLTDSTDGILNGKRYLIHDRDPLFTGEFLVFLGERLGAGRHDCGKLTSARQFRRAVFHIESGLRPYWFPGRCLSSPQSAARNQSHVLGPYEICYFPPQHPILEVIRQPYKFQRKSSPKVPYFQRSERFPGMHNAVICIHLQRRP